MPLTVGVILILAIAATARRPTAGQQPPDRPSFVSGASELVVLPVTVTDRQGRLISDLPQERFVVFDQGRQQDVVLFSSEDVPVSIALVIDDSGSMRSRLGRSWRQLFPLPAGAIRRTNCSRSSSTTRSAMRSGVRGLKPVIHVSSNRARTLVPQGQTALYDALLTALNRLDHATHARKYSCC